MTDSEAAIRREVAEAYRAVCALGMNAGSAGNVSARCAPGMVITPTGATRETVSEAALVPVSFDGAAAGAGRPSSEWPMHAAIYAACPEAAFILHTHAEACTALAALGEDLPAFHYMVLQFGGPDVRCAPYVTFGTKELAAVAARAITGRRACLLGNHGMIVYGRSAAEALHLAQQLELLCRVYLMARAAGTPRLLTEAEVAAGMQRLETYAAGLG